MTSEEFMSIEPLYKQENQALAKPASLFLRNLLLALRVLGLVFLIGFIIVFVLAGLALAGFAPVAKIFEVTSPFMAFISSASMIVGAIVFLIIIKQLLAICNTLLNGDPFVPQNAKRLRAIWIAVAIGEVLRLLSSALISWQGQKVQDASYEIEWSLDLRLYVWFMVLALIILSAVFKEGARMRLEQKLTV